MASRRLVLSSYRAVLDSLTPTRALRFARTESRERGCKVTKSAAGSSQPPARISNMRPDYGYAYSHLLRQEEVLCLRQAAGRDSMMIRVRASCFGAVPTRLHVVARWCSAGEGETAPRAGVAGQVYDCIWCCFSAGFPPAHCCFLPLSYGSLLAARSPSRLILV